LDLCETQVETENSLSACLRKKKMFKLDTVEIMLREIRAIRDRPATELFGFRESILSKNAKIS
jgi:hypothetical protein